MFAKKVSHGQSLIMASCSGVEGNRVPKRSMFFKPESLHVSKVLQILYNDNSGNELI